MCFIRHTNRISPHYTICVLPFAFSPKMWTCRVLQNVYIECEWIRPPGHYLISLAKIVQNNGKYFCTSLTLSQMSTQSRIRCKWRCYCCHRCHRYYYYHPCFDVCLLCYVLFCVSLCVSVYVVVLRLFYGFSHSFNISRAQTRSHSLIYLPTPSSSRILTANKPKSRSLTLAVALVLFWCVLQNCIYTFDRTLFQ